MEGAAARAFFCELAPRAAPPPLARALLFQD
jgi:hypothetical protein